MPGYFPGAAGRKICARIVPVGVSKSATSLSLIIVVIKNVFLHYF
jgi:hypothetical protein